MSAAAGMLLVGFGGSADCLQRNGGRVPRHATTQGIKPPTSIGKGEGKLNIIAWEGYTQPEWVKPFETTTGCQGQREVRRVFE